MSGLPPCPLCGGPAYAGTSTSPRGICWCNHDACLLCGVGMPIDTWRALSALRWTDVVERAK